MTEAFVWGLVAASSLVIGALLALAFRIHLRAIGLIMGFGAGVLISAVAFDLVEEAASQATGNTPIVAGLFAGCGVFFAGALLIDRFGGGERKDAKGAQASGSALAIVLGTILDGIPESMALGLSLLDGGSIGVAYLSAVFISNLPESISSTSGLASGGWRTAKILRLWVIIALISGVSSLLGYSVFDGASPNMIAFVLSFAAGAIITMLADTMMPEAYENGGRLAGVVTTLGFATAFLLHALA